MPRCHRNGCPGVSGTAAQVTPEYALKVIDRPGDKNRERDLSKEYQDVWPAKNARRIEASLEVSEDQHGSTVVHKFYTDGTAEGDLSADELLKQYRADRDLEDGVRSLKG